MGINKVKTQHYVPRFYLENFSKDSQLWVFDKLNENKFKTAIDNIACENYFYDHQILNEVTGEQFIEKTLSSIEGMLAPKFKNFLLKVSPGYLLTEEDRILVSEMMVLQLSRTREQRTLLSQFDDQFSEAFKKYGIRDSLANTDKDQKHLDFMLKMLTNTEAYEKFFEKIWLVHINQTQHSLYTSDSPAFGHIHQDIRFNAYEVFMPLTPQIGISALTPQAFPQFQDMDGYAIPIVKTENIKFYNSLVTSKAYRFIFNKVNNFKLAEKIVREFPEVKDINRRRVGHV